MTTHSRYWDRIFCRRCDRMTALDKRNGRPRLYCSNYCMSRYRKATK